MHKFERRLLLFVLAAAVVASLAGCGGNAATATEAPTKAAQATSAPAPTDKPAATQAPQATKPAETTAAPKATLPAATDTAPVIQNVDSNIDKLDSYAMSFVITTKGTDKDGKAAEQSLNFLQEIVKSKSQSHIRMGGTSISADASGSIDIYQIDKLSYMLTQDKNQAAPTCLSFSSDKPTFDQSALFKPDQMVRDIHAETLVARGEMVNGVKADHYKVRQAVLGFGTSNGTGDMWVAQDGGYAVKFSIQSDGTFNLSAADLKGTMTMEYNLSSINLLKEITLPEVCQGQGQGLKDLPLPPNATDVNSMGDLYTFKSPDKPGVVADFFRKELPGKGWKITDDSSLSEDFFTINAEKEGKKVSIMLTADGGGTSGLITVTTQK